MSNYQDVKSFRKRTKERIIYVMGEKCAICGYNKCSSALELYHLDPSEKDFTFSQNMNKSWAKISIELPKTILVCANCHREIHAGLITDNLKSSYSEERNQEIIEELEEIKHKKLHYCKDCGILISDDADRCKDCYDKYQRQVERPSREVLKQEIRSMPFTALGKKYNVSDNAIRKWCDKYSLPRTKAEINSYSDEEWLKI